MRLLDEEASKCGSWRRAFPVANGYIYRPFFAKERPLNWLLCDVLARRARGEPDVGPFVAPYPSVPHQPASERPVHATAAAAAAATPAADDAPTPPGSPAEQRRRDAPRPTSACAEARSPCPPAACAATRSGPGEAAAPAEAAACGRRPPSALSRVNVEAHQGSWATPVDASSAGAGAGADGGGGAQACGGGSCEGAQACGEGGAGTSTTAGG